MKTGLLLKFIFLFIALGAFRNRTFHPGSGIVVDKKGQVYISDLSRGLFRIDEQGHVTKINNEGGHYLALDKNGSFSQVDFTKSQHSPRWFKRRTPFAMKPTLIADGGSPLIVGEDGNLYFVCNDEKLTPGGLQIGRVTPEGKESLLNPDLMAISAQMGGIRGLAQGPDGSLYFSYQKAIYTITLSGEITPFINPVVVNDCNLNVSAHVAPFLTGLTLDSSGNMYVAASGCGCVLKITSDKKVSIVLKAQKPWAPTGIALNDGTIYVLEHINPNSDEHEDWQPRVRKIARNNRISTLATIK